MLLKKAEGYGLIPWWYYFGQTFMNAIPPFSLVYILAVIIYITYLPNDSITWVIAPFLLFHIIEPHKEIRFLFPHYRIPSFDDHPFCEIILKKRGFDLMENRFVRILVKAFWYTSLVMVVILYSGPRMNRSPL